MNCSKELRLAVALRSRDAHALKELAAEEEKHRKPLADLALAAVGEAGDLQSAAGWLLRVAPSGDDEIGNYVHRATRRALLSSDVGLDDPQAVAAALPAIADDLLAILGHATRMTQLHDPIAA